MPCTSQVHRSPFRHNVLDAMAEELPDLASSISARSRGGECAFPTGVSVHRGALPPRSNRMAAHDVPAGTHAAPRPVPIRHRPVFAPLSRMLPNLRMAAGGARTHILARLAKATRRGRRPCKVGGTRGLFGSSSLGAEPLCQFPGAGKGCHVEATATAIGCVALFMSPRTIFNLGKSYVLEPLASQLASATGGRPCRSDSGVLGADCSRAARGGRARAARTNRTVL